MFLVILFPQFSCSILFTTIIVFSFFGFLIAGFPSVNSTNPFDNQTDDNFEAVFGQSKPTNPQIEPMSGILKPTVPSVGATPAAMDSSSNSDQSAGDLHATLNRVAKSLGQSLKTFLSAMKP